jgi:NADPH:quinone reductase
MRAAVLTGSGVEIQDVPSPRPKPSEVLVRVRACGLNRADLQMASGHRHGSMGGAGSVAGMEFAGEVIEAGAEAKGFKAGDRVMCGGSGAFGEQAVADYGRTMRIPDGVSFEQAASFPVALNTLHNALVTLGRLKAGEAVLIQGASSGVGIMGMQIAKFMGAKFVVGTSTNEARKARLKEFGADLVVDTRDPKWPEQVVKATDGGVHLTVDMLSGPVVNQTMAASRVLARIVNIGRLAGMKAEFDFDLHALKRIDYIGATFRTRSIEEVREINRRMQADLWDALVGGKLRMPIDRTFPLSEAPAAYAHARANAHFGKVVLTV